MGPEIQIFSPGWVVSHGNPSFLEIGVPVTVCGQVVDHGDLLHVDATGDGTC
jgi:hypothetical protein